MSRAGEPARCVTIYAQQSLMVSETSRHTLIYRDGRTTWVNELANYCRFGINDVLVTEPIGSQYCRGDIIRSFDRISHIPGPGCVLGEFVPYKRN